MQDVTGKFKFTLLNYLRLGKNLKARNLNLSDEIYVVSHKKTRMPEGNIYLPVQVGPSGENFPGFMRDNTGDNIAEKNPNYCELTVQYWAWKNRDADVKGIVHYRRLFSNGKQMLGASPEKKFNNVLDEKTLNEIMKDYDVILPRKRNYYIETLWSHYIHSHKTEGIVALRNVIAEEYPEYLDKFDEVTRRRKAHMFNMIIAKSPVFDEYSKWFFEVLGKVEKRVDISDYSTYEARIYGFLSELLMDVWIEHNGIKYYELPVMFMEKQNLARKFMIFIGRKLGLVTEVKA